MDFWLVADTQNREQFTNSSGNLAVADSDEYDDFGSGRGGGYYNTAMTTAPINVAGRSNLQFSFDSSWRDETFDDAHTLNPALGGGSVNNQTVVIYASFDDAAPVKVTQWHSDPSGSEFKDDAENEHLTFPITAPDGAQNMKVTLAYLNAGNDWWWAVDNLEVSEGANPAFWSENFDSLTLGPSVNERLSRYTRTSSSDPNTTPVPNAFTHTPPAGWNIDNSLMGGNPVDDDFGVFEWEGWTFTTNDFSVFTGNTQLAAFTKSTGNHAAADSDAYFPLGSAAPLSTILETPNINIAGVAADDLKLQFDSAWQTSGAQNAVVTIDYGAGEVTVLDWRSDSSDPLFHATNLNETVFVDLDNPAGATTAKVRFKYLEGNNDWFWAIDNIRIGTTAVPLSGDFNGDGSVDAADYVVWRNGLGTTHTQEDYNVWRANFGRTAGSASSDISASTAVPEPATVVMVLAGMLSMLQRRRALMPGSARICRGSCELLPPK
jgi:hypothetical protein